ncbi:hypothetical protein NsoK4_06390 [Nitrosopumilus sp. K4]|uniref:hypothetical protein n=1 Tax=Nitrosopumilus sp. K4 TaxID=2795383 RepID=UPI001BA54BC1|nr:hypothetical protein [Nitrosopumilus sp. K4]QUC64075.1 hypothetical protein NsoK4_06390 [Nitrosopumilus sp. K4]
MLKKASTIFLAITLVAVMVVGFDMESADAKKASGTFNPKYGSATAGIVCGDRLCSEPEMPKPISTPKTEKHPEPKSTNTCGNNAIQTESGCSNLRINGAKITKSYYHASTGVTTIKITAQNDGKLTINAPLNNAFILVDGEEWNDVLLDGKQTVIEFFAGTEKIEIFGN